MAPVLLTKEKDQIIRMDSEKLYYHTLARYLAGECTDEERIYIERWAGESPENQRRIAEYKHIWNRSGNREIAMEKWIDIEEDWEFMNERITRAEKMQVPDVKRSPGDLYTGRVSAHSSYRPFLRVAAIFVLMVLSGFLVYQLTYEAQPVQKDVVLREIGTDNGQRVNLTLSDGTRVLVNAGSRLKLPNTFQPDKREVFLQGEAYFDVAENAEAPFLIHSGETLIRVLGTSFSVRSYPEDEQIQVVVKEGRVSFEEAGKDTPDKITLTQSELGQYDLQSKQLRSQKVEDLELYLGWTEGYLKFKEKPMSRVALELERRYDIKVDFKDPEIKQMLLTANLKSRSISNVLDVIAMSLKVDYRLKEDKVTFY